MSDYAGNNIFEKIGAFIPGYKGYSEKEGRRDTDKLLRIEIAKYLDLRKADVDAVIRRQMGEKKLDHVSELDRIKRKIDLVANQIRFASYGECGFFDVVQVDTADLDRLYQFDLTIQDEVNRFAILLKELSGSENLRQSCSAAIDTLSALSEKMQNRDKVIMEVQ